MSETLTPTSYLQIIPDWEELDFHAGKEIKALEDYFREAIPKFLEYIKNKEVTHILLLEKTARLLRVPLMRLFKREWLSIMIWSYASDYFQSLDISRSRKQEFLTQRKLQERKLNFLPKPNWNYIILVLDEFICTWFWSEQAVKWLIDLWYREENIVSLWLDSERGMWGLHQTWTLERVFYNWVNDKFFNPFLPDSTQKQVFYPRLNPEHLFSYRELVQRLTSIILTSSQK